MIKHTNKQVIRDDCLYIYLLGWEPSVAQVTNSYFRLATFNRLLKSIHLTQSLKTKLKTFPRFSRFPQSKLRHMSYSLKNKQTKKQIYSGYMAEFQHSFLYALDCLVYCIKLEIVFFIIQSNPRILESSYPLLHSLICHSRTFS